MQDLAISGTSDFKTFPKGCPRIPLTTVLEDRITRAPKSKLVLGPQISLGAVHAVYDGFGIFEYQL